MRRHRAELTQVCDDAAVFVHRVLQALEGVVNGAEGEDDFGQLTLQRLQLVIVGGSSNHTVAVQGLSSFQPGVRSAATTAAAARTSTCWGSVWTAHYCSVLRPKGGNFD